MILNLIKLFLMVLNLLRFSENYALKNNKKGLTVCVLYKNERAKKLYSEYGFKEEYTVGD